MNDPLERLQQHLGRLEAGEPLDQVIGDLPEAEAELVRLAAEMRTTVPPQRSAGASAAQRRALIRAASKRKNNMSRQTQPRRPRWAGLGLAFGAAGALLMCGLAVLAAAAAWWSIGSSGEALSRSPIQRIGDAITSLAGGNAAALRPPDAQTAIITEARGVIEVQAADGTWHAARLGSLIRAGERLRTRALSSLALAFFDGSLARLGPDTEVAVTALDAQRSGPRVVRLTQISGGTEHVVAHSGDAASAYEVATASGTGAAKGTAFTVQLTGDGRARFEVSQGAVAVANGGSSVLVIAGQSTVVAADLPPAEPLFAINGEGEVESRGAVWVVAGQSFDTDATTLITGDPQIGDWVSVQGRLLPDGTAFADRITLLRRAVENRFAFTGLVQVISDTQWTVAGQIVNVDALTDIEPGLAVGDLVEVRGSLLDGALWAASLRRVAANGFEFTGVVESMGADRWTISGITVTVDLTTTIDAGLAVGDVAHVTGEVLADGTWLARTIRAVELQTFSFVGVVIRMDPWNVSGVELATDADTQIDDGINVGNRVRVTGRVLLDGTWLAETIEQLDEGRRHAIRFTARVESVDPWVVGGVTLTVDAKTRIIGDPEVGDLAHVMGNLLPDGEVLAKKIIRVDEGLGCTESVGIVQSIDGDEVTLLDGTVIALDETIEVDGDLREGSVIVIRSCLGEDGVERIVSLTVIYQLGELPTPTPTATPEGTPTVTPTPTPAGTLAAKVTVCHKAGSKNQHSITISADALPAHLGHGDTLGPCP